MLSKPNFDEGETVNFSSWQPVCQPITQVVSSSNNKYKNAPKSIISNKSAERSEMTI